jgi:hypothetical protein
MNRFFKRHITFRRFASTLVALFTLTLVTSALAHPGHEHKMLGTVTMAASDHIMLKERDGREQTVYIDKETKIRREKKPAKIQDIQTGVRVVVTAVTQKERMIARKIELGATPASN